MKSDGHSTGNDGRRSFLSRSDRIWVRQRFEWLIATFGIKKVWEAPFLTLCERDFPDPYSGTQADAELLFSRICGYLELDVNRLKLRFYSRDDPIEMELAEIPSDAAGLYQPDKEKPIVWLDRALLDNSEILIAVITHELCHEILLGQNHLNQEHDRDHEGVTDLLTIFLGMGVFTGNTYLPRKLWFQDSLETASRRRLGYLSLGALGYSLALMAWYRNETQPEWLKDLNPKLRQLVQRNIDRLWKSRGNPSSIPTTLVSQVADSVRRIPTEELVRPEIVASDYEIDDYATVVTAVCHKCQEAVEFPIELAGQTTSCPECGSYLDVPTLPGGRRAKLTSQWNIRKQNEINWKRHNLTTKWRNYFICIAILIGLPILLIERDVFHPFVAFPFMVGIVLGTWFTVWWYELKQIERQLHQSPPSDQ